MDQQDKAFMTVFSAVIGVLVLIAVFIFILAHWIVDDESAGLDSLRMEQAAKRLEKPGRIIINGTPEAEQEQASAAAAMQPAAGDSAGAAVAAADGAAVYEQVCAACHTSGVLNAPKLGDNLEWMTRNQKGMDTLLRHATEGFNQMPAQSPGVPEDGVRAAILHILSESGVTVEGVEAASASASPPAEAQPAEAQPAEQAATEQVAADTQPAEQTAAESQPTEQAATEQNASVSAPPLQAEPVQNPPVSSQTVQTPPVSAAAEQTTASTTETQAEQPAAVSAVGAATTGASMPADLDLAEGQQTYENVCRFCHAGTLPTAPTFGDKEAWAPRIAQGWETLKEHTLQGTAKGMPPKGGRADLADAQVLNALGYMIQNSQ